MGLWPGLLRQNRDALRIQEFSPEVIRIEFPYPAIPRAIRSSSTNSEPLWMVCPALQRRSRRLLSAREGSPIPAGHRGISMHRAPSLPALGISDMAAAWFLDSRKAPPRPFSTEDVSSSIPHVHLLSQSSDGVHGWPGMHYVDGLRHQVRVYIYQRRGRLTLLVRQSDARLRCAPGDNLVQTIAVC